MSDQTNQRHMHVNDNTVLTSILKRNLFLARNEVIPVLGKFHVKKKSMFCSTVTKEVFVLTRIHVQFFDIIL